VIEDKPRLIEVKSAEQMNIEKWKKEKKIENFTIIIVAIILIIVATFLLSL
jgi:hypothetical protein